ncbi:MAG: hypothetical protein U9M98_00135 [Patescibacteria group bacterium]|nr:hypothetical protein [Patescibacteria group bacterium]
MAKNNQKDRSFSQNTLQFIEEYQQKLDEKKEEESLQTIHVDTIASKVAAFYERLRIIIDWKDEHLIRRTAIERNLKRRFLSELGFRFNAKLDPHQIAEDLLIELIRAGHFPNNTIPKKRISDLAEIIKKYIIILENSEKPRQNTKERVNFYHWVLEMGACEIEEALEPPIKQKALLTYMTNQLSKRLRLDPELRIQDREKWTLTYIAVHRALFRLDSPLIHYHLLRKKYSDWKTTDETRLKEIARELPATRTEFEKLLEHPLYPKFYKYCERYNTFYLILSDVLDMLEKHQQKKEKKSDQKVEPLNVKEELKNPKKWKPLAKAAFNERSETLRSRLNRIAIYSTLSIFVGGIFSLFLVEVPLARLFAGRFSPMALAIDLLVPTALMFILVGTARKPEKENLENVIEGLEKTIYQEGKWGIYQIDKPRKHGFIANFLITLFYFLVWGISLSAIVAIFYFAQVPIPSVVLDTINVAVVTFVGIEIRQRADDLKVGEEKTNFFNFIFDTLSLPVAKFGKWLSDKWKEYNVVSVFFTALVDMPFLAFIELVESWSAFLKEKKSGIYS